MTKILAFDVGGTSVKYGLWQKGKLMGQSSFTTPASWHDMKQKMVQIKDQHENLRGVACSFPGAVDVTQGRISGSSAVPYIHNFNIIQELTESFGLPVSIQNDANCAALAEVWQGNARDVASSIFLILGSGVGGAVVVDGKIQTGTHLFGGEFGYQVLDWHTGKTVSELATPVSVGHNYSQMIADGHEYSGHDVFDLEAQGEKLASQIVNDFYQSLGCVVYNAALTIDPETILIGGAVSQRPELIPRLKKAVVKQVEDHDAHGLEINLKPCLFLAAANLLGAVYQFLSEHDLLISEENGQKVN